MKTPFKISAEKTIFQPIMNLKNQEMKRFTLLLFSVTVVTCAFGQKALSIPDFEKQGIKLTSFDSLYKDAVNIDSSKAVFKTESEQQTMGKEWMKLLQDFGDFLKKNNFEWNETTKCFNKIYFNPDGTIEYFLYNFTSKNKETLSPEKLEKFNDLLNEFIKDYKISLSADEKFIQCGPANFKPTLVE